MHKIRKNISHGTHLMVIKKEDQGTGKLTDGVTMGDDCPLFSKNAN